MDVRTSIAYAGRVFSIFRKRTPSTAITRTASPFAPAISASTTVAPPQRKQGGGSDWSLESIRTARDAQLRGQFELPVRMAEAFRTNDALFTAYQARVATQSAIRLAWRPVDTDGGRAAAVRAKRLIHTPQHVRESILGTMANHGLAIGYVLHETLDTLNGPAVCMTLTEWPLEHVRYNPSTCTLETRTRDNGTVTITHGDGRWIVFRKFGLAPWTQDACVLPGSFIWAAHAGGVSDWAGASYSHGQPKTVGMLPEGVPLGDRDNTALLSPEATAILSTLATLAAGDSTAGVLPHGAEAKLLFNGSTAWQVFKELILDRSKAAMRIYCGTDAALGSQGGAPGVDVASLFSVASTRIQGDFEALERGYLEGMVEPWAVLHGIGRADAPALVYEMPDVDGDRRAAQEATAIERLATSVKALKDSGMSVTQDVVTSLATVLTVSVPCNLAAEETRAVPLQLAPTDVARVVKVKEARIAQGLPALNDSRDDLFISELEAATKAATAAPPAPAPAARTIRLRADIDGDGIDDGFYYDEDGEKVHPKDDIEMVAARDELEFQRREFELRRKEYAELIAERDAAATDLPERKSQLDAEEANESDMSEAYEVAKEERREARAELKELRDTPTADLDRKDWEDADGNEISGHDAIVVNEAYAAITEENVQITKSNLSNAKAERKAAAKEYRKADRRLDAAEDKLLDAEEPSSHEVEAAQEHYGRTAERIAAEARAEGDEEKAAAFEAHRDSVRSEVQSDEGDAEKPAKSDADADTPAAPDDPHAVEVGPKGGRYYLAPSGEKVYLD